MSSFSKIFPETLKRSTYERIPLTEEIVGNYVQKSITDQINLAKKNKLPSVIVHVMFPHDWSINGTTDIIAKLIDVMVSRFEPIEIPWGLTDWRVIHKEDTVTLCLNFITEFRFTLNLS